MAIHEIEAIQGFGAPETLPQLEGVYSDEVAMPVEAMQVPDTIRPNLQVVTDESTSKEITVGEAYTPEQAEANALRCRELAKKALSFLGPEASEQVLATIEQSHNNSIEKLRRTGKI